MADPTPVSEPHTPDDVGRSSDIAAARRRDDVGERAAARTLEASQTFLARAFLLGALVCWATDQPGVGVLCLVTVLCMLLQQRALRRGAAWRRVANLFLTELLLIFAAMTLASLGRQLTFTYLGMLLVMFTVLIRGVRVGATMAAAAVGVVVLAHLLLELGVEPILSPDPDKVAAGKFYGAAILTLTTLWVMTQHGRARQRAEEEAEQHRQAEERLERDYERLRTLAGGVAHDFNNVLQSIVGQAELARQQPTDAEQVGRHLEAVVVASHRAAGVVDNMLLFAGRRQPRLRPVDVGRLADELVELTRPLMSPGVSLAWDRCPTGLWVQGDPDQLSSLVLNLVRNADEAVAAAGGVVRLRADRLSVDQADLVGSVVAPADLSGEVVLLEVEDDGPGIAEPLRRRIFDPFFSTRDEGHGLGLATAPTIAQAHGGALQLRTAPGEGTTFRLLLPAVAAPRPATTSPGREAPLADRTVLVADDDEAVRTVTCTFLERAGARVLAARNGTEALDLHAQAKGTVDLALLDLAMPGMDGRQTVAALRSREPDLPLVILSGYWLEELAEEPDLAGVTVLHKPLTRAELLAGVAAALGESA